MHLRRGKLGLSAALIAGAMIFAPLTAAAQEGFDFGTEGEGSSGDGGFDFGNEGEGGGASERRRTVRRACSRFARRECIRAHLLRFCLRLDEITYKEYAHSRKACRASHLHSSPFAPDENAGERLFLHHSSLFDG